MIPARVGAFICNRKYLGHMNNWWNFRKRNDERNNTSMTKHRNNKIMTTNHIVSFSGCRLNYWMAPCMLRWWFVAGVGSDATIKLWTKFHHFEKLNQSRNYRHHMSWLQTTTSFWNPLGSVVICLLRVLRTRKELTMQQGTLRCEATASEDTKLRQPMKVPHHCRPQTTTLLLSVRGVVNSVDSPYQRLERSRPCPRRSSAHFS